MCPLDTTFQALEPEVDAPTELDAEDVAEDDHIPLLPLLDGACQTPPTIVAGAAVEPVSEKLSNISCCTSTANPSNKA